MNRRTRSSKKKKPSPQQPLLKGEQIEESKENLEITQKKIKKGKTAKPSDVNSKKASIQKKVIERKKSNHSDPENLNLPLIEEKEIIAQEEEIIPEEEEIIEEEKIENMIEEEPVLDDNNTTERLLKEEEIEPDETENIQEEVEENLEENSKDEEMEEEGEDENAFHVNYMDTLEESNLKQIENLNLYSSTLAPNSNRIIERQFQQQPYDYSQEYQNELKADFYDKEDDFEKNESIQEMMIILKKNPIALLNEYCSKAKQILEYRFQSEGIQKKQKFLCKAFLEKKPLHNDFQIGLSKQEAKNECAKLAIMTLSRDPKPRSILTNLLIRQRKNQNMNLSAGKNYHFNTIEELMENDANLLSVLNTFAQNSKESLKWRIRTEGNVCVAELRIGQITASAVKNNKKQAKVWAAKNILKTINSNTFLKDKFMYFAKNMKEINERNTEKLKDVLMTDKPIVEQKIDVENLRLEKFNPSEKSIEKINSWFDILNKKIELPEQEFYEIKQVFEDVSDILLNLSPSFGLKLIPVGSFLTGSMRSSKLQADAVIYDESLSFDISMEKIKKCFYERRGSFQLINNTYHLYEARVEHNPNINSSELIFTHSIKKIEVRISDYSDNGHEYNNTNSRLINKKNSIIYHTIWLEEFMNLNTMNREVLKILRIVREWRDVHSLSIPSEILDLGVYYSTSYFKEFDVVRVLFKFFALFNLLLNSYNFYFYELSEYHSFFFNSMREKDKEKVLSVAQNTFLNLSKNNPNEFMQRFLQDEFTLEEKVVGEETVKEEELESG